MALHVANLGYCTFTSTDLSAWKHYATDVLGLSLVGESSDRLTFKMDDHPYRLAVEKGDADKLGAAGWEMAHEADFNAALKNLARAGVSVTQGDEAGAAARAVTRYAQAADPAGNVFEIYYGRTGIGAGFQSPAGVQSFVTGSMGMGHLVIPAENIDETHAFYTNVLGFMDSDNLTMPPPAEGLPDQRLRFMHAANPRHHSLALYSYPVPTGIVHLMFEVPDVDHVGACLDRATSADIKMMSTLGRHANDRMLSFYMFGPGGIGIEYGCEGLQIDPHQFEPTVSTEADIWGHIYYFHQDG